MVKLPDHCSGKLSQLLNALALHNTPLHTYLLGKEGGVSGGVFDHGTYEEDGPVTWEALASPRHIPA